MYGPGPHATASRAAPLPGGRGGPHSAPAPAVQPDKAKAVPDRPAERGRLAHQRVASDSSLAAGYDLCATKGDRAGVGFQEVLGNQADSRCNTPERLPQMWQ